MTYSRRTLLRLGSAVVLTGAGAGVGGVLAAGPAGAEPFPSRTTPVGGRSGWTSGVCDDHPEAFGTWRGSPTGIAGMYADTDVAAQLEQYIYTHSTFSGDVDLAPGGPIDHTWAQTAAGAELDRWTSIAAVLRDNWHYRTVYLRFAHEANGTWMPWSVPADQVPAFRAAYRLFVTTMRRELAGRDVKFVFGANFGSWAYSPDTMWPGNDVVDVVGVSMYEFVKYDTPAAWAKFAASSVGPDRWATFARQHGKPMAFSEWGALTPYFLSRMNAWMAAHAGPGPGRLLYDVYLNTGEFALTGAAASRYRSLHWGR
jgi:hypothetical protein